MATTGELMRQAVELHRGGQLDAAGRLYRQVLDADPRSQDAWHLLGLVEHVRGNSDAALAHIGRAIELDASRPAFHMHLAEVYRGLGRLDEAQQSGRRALALGGALPLVHNTLGLVLCDLRRFSEAETCFRRAVALDGRLGLAHFNLALALRAQDRLDEARAECRAALECDGELLPPWRELGEILREQGRAAEAIDAYRDALSRHPAWVEGHCQLGALLDEQGDTQGAVAAFDRALAYSDDCGIAHYNLGVIYERQFDLARAEESYVKALAADPKMPAALNNLGNVLKAQGRFAKAEACYDRAADVDPSYAQARFNQAMNRMVAGDFAGGWPLMEWRWKCPGFTRRFADRTAWQGEPLEGRTLLAYGEQGLGDTLQFLRFVPELARRASRLILEVPRALLPIVRRAGFDRVAQVVDKGEPPGEFDASVSLLAAAGLLGVTVDNIPAAEGYLLADAALVERWRGVLGDDTTFKVGIAWQGNREYRGDRWRSPRLAHFAPLARPGVELISLQKGFGAEQLAELGGAFRVRDLGPELDEAHGPFMDTAAVMKNLDLVVTSDTAIAHLAGALGVPVWVALPLAADWRWMQKRADSPWYAGMTLFRQPQFDDWPALFARIAAELGDRIG